MNQGFGVFGYFATVVPGQPIETGQWAAEPGVDIQPFIKGFHNYRSLVDPNVQLGMHSNLICGYSSEMMPAFFQTEHTLIKHIVPFPETKNSFGINSLGPDWNGALFASFVSPDHPHPVSAATRSLLREIAYHLSIASHIVSRPRGMTCAEAFADFQKNMLQSVFLSPIAQYHNDLGQRALEQVALMADQQEPQPHRLPPGQAISLFGHLLQGGLILHHRFEQDGDLLWVVQRPIPFLQPRTPLTHEEWILFSAFAKHESLKQAVAYLPNRRSLGYAYQLLQSIAAKLSLPETKPEHLVPIAKVWLASTDEQGRWLAPKHRPHTPPPPGLRATVFSIGQEFYVVIRTQEETKHNLPTSTALPQSSMRWILDAMAGKSPQEIAQANDLSLTTVLRRLATARRMGLLSPIDPLSQK